LQEWGDNNKNLQEKASSYYYYYYYYGGGGGGDDDDDDDDDEIENFQHRPTRVMIMRKKSINVGRKRYFFCRA
jgi:hypothetical protein